MLQRHNIAPAEAWGLGGTDWEFISFGLSDAIGHAVQCLWPEPGERVIDIGTGTGWGARLSARLGAEVVGVDFAEGMIGAARQLSAHLGSRLAFQVAEAEALPFPAASFDGALSTYGVMFSAEPDRAAAEIARVLKPGGRMVLTTWADEPAGYIPSFFALVGRHAGDPPPEPSPMRWGDPGWLAEAFGRDFELAIEERPTTLYAPDAERVWKKYLAGFGPMRLAAEALPPAELDAFRQDFHDLHAAYDTGNGLRIDRKALLVRGVRR
jgi:SAM-dependent methyltransferase